MQRVPNLRPVALKEEEKSGPQLSQTAKALEAEEEETTKTSSKKPPYLAMFPDAMIKFTRVSKVKTAKLSVLKKPQLAADDTSEGPCGLVCITIAWCQRFNSIRWFMAFYCALLLSQGIVFGLTDVSNNDFEQHHILTTTEKLALTLSYDISSCLLALFIAYYGGNGSRTKWIALSSFLVGFGSLLLAFPYFGVKKYESEVKTEGTAKIKARKQREFRLFESRLNYWKFGGSIKDLFGAVWGVEGCEALVLCLEMDVDQAASQGRMWAGVSPPLQWDSLIGPRQSDRELLQLMQRIYV
ncbi:Solute carrier organic anion transporter family member 6A1 [Heterocephalus glaber]|uniref:Solute carrier organic anion transporter family member 6A1 n=1 Tax=Heterocephalus glaber TaxID=10181 RepID=G5BDL8_HETGA|nr:Solute carrier organic anion transporter family member 6A1 [Heterocephalus glaber]